MEEFEDPRSEEELRWGPCDCHSSQYWDELWDTVVVFSQDELDDYAWYAARFL